MKSTDIIHRFYELISQFLDETHLSTQLSLSFNQPSLPQNISSDLLISSLEKFISSVQVLTSFKSGAENEATIQEVNSELVQIVASNSEIDRRIQAFMNRKQTEVDEANCLEFCSVTTSVKEDNSCARTDAVFIPRSGTKSHVKVSRVAHAYGPQTRPHLIKAENIKIESSVYKSPQKRERNEGIEERLQNMESFLKLRRGQRVPADVYQRIKVLEDRILQLESLSPEYFSICPSPFKRQRLARSASDDTDLEEIDSKIKQLQESIRKKKVSTPTESKSPS